MQKVKVSDLNACVMKRSRHDHIIKELNRLNVKINFITDGDIAGVLSVIGSDPKNDIYYSTGGGPHDLSGSCIVMLWRPIARKTSIR